MKAAVVCLVIAACGRGVRDGGSGGLKKALDTFQAACGQIIV